MYTRASPLTHLPTHLLLTLLRKTGGLVSILVITVVIVIIMTSETQPLNVNSNGEPELPPPPPPPPRRRRKRGFPRWLLIVLAIIFLAAIFVSVVIVVRAAERRRQQSKELWINLQEASSSSVLPGCETTVLLMRHCEKFGPLVVGKNGNQHCSYVGMERAHFLPHIFGTRWPNPSYLYALSPIRDSHLNYREMETLTPLSKTLGIEINADFKEGEHDALAQDIFTKMQTGDLCGKLTVVSWTHRSLPQLANSLGCFPSYEMGGCPSAFPESSFDEVWMLKYVYKPTYIKKEKKWDKWHVYPTITQMNFDPLAFSFQEGDYPMGGMARGGAWSYNKVKVHQDL